jgi:CRP-like cAMP-binding protein
MAYYAPMTNANTDADPTSRLPGGMKLYAAAILVGLFVVPPLIWLTGRALFGPYANGGLFSLWGDFFGELSRGARSAWVVALAPCVLIALLQGAVALSRRLR